MTSLELGEDFKRLSNFVNEMLSGLHDEMMLLEGSAGDKAEKLPDDWVEDRQEMATLYMFNTMEASALQRSFMFENVDYRVDDLLHDVHGRDDHMNNLLVRKEVFDGLCMSSLAHWLPDKFRLRT